MREGKLQYFSEEEFALLMELAGEGDYALFLTTPELDERRLTEAMTRLFRRGVLSRVGDELELSEESAFFHELRGAASILLIRGGLTKARTILCYVCPERIWLAELQGGSPAERYRLSSLVRGQMRKWLFDAEILPRPRLRETDVEELQMLLEGGSGWNLGDNPTVRIVKSDCSGRTLQEFSLYSGTIWRLSQSAEEGSPETQIYTWETLNKLLRQCFGG